MLKIKKEIIALCEESEKELYDQFKEIDIQCLKNSQDVINAFHKFQVSEFNFIEIILYNTLLFKISLILFILISEEYF